MKVIGITGGVGAGKSLVLNYLQKNYRCKILVADDIGRNVQQRDNQAYFQLINLFGEDILDSNRELNRSKMADLMFADSNLRKKTEEIIHPAVKETIEKEIEKARKESEDYVFIEAALLIEAGYLDILDELWYVFAKESIRRERLKKNREYSDEKINAIIKSQLNEETFCKYATKIIENNDNPERTFKQINEAMGENK